METAISVDGRWSGLEAVAVDEQGTGEAPTYIQQSFREKINR